MMNKSLHDAVAPIRNRRRLAEIKAKYAAYDAAKRTPWYETLWCALWAGFTVARGVLKQ